MKLLALFLAAQIIAFAAFAQVSGVAKDAQGQPLKGATVSLMKAADSSIVKLAATKEDGSYTFPSVAEGSYLVSISHIG
ncbi:MAG TPA: carboxypeptidase-like regulatory domain-containing protein, partial [Flavisolibacter sp.]